jgi:hypothetical protein
MNRQSWIGIGFLSLSYGIPIVTGHRDILNFLSGCLCTVGALLIAGRIRLALPAGEKP